MGAGAVVTVSVMVALVVVGLAVLKVYQYFESKPVRRQAALTAGEIDRAYLAREMARLLDRGLADPTIRVSPRWEEQAERLVNDYYEGER